MLRTGLAGLAVAAGAGGGLGAAVARAYTVRLSVTHAPLARPLPAGYLGLGLEYSTIPEWIATGPQRGNPVLVQLVRALDPAGRPVIRIGGQSTDRSWWPVPGMSRPLGVTYSLGARWTAAAHVFAQSVDARLLIGINLEADRTRIAQLEAARLVAGIGRRYVGALELGNEPLLYSRIPWYRELGGQPVPWYRQKGTAVYGRPRSYGPAQFVGEFVRMLRVLPRLPIAGPETGNPPWLAEFSRFLSPHSRVRMLTSHAYGLNECVGDPASPSFPTVRNMLAPIASRGLLQGVPPYVALAHRDGATYRIDEMGSVSCNGRAGVSNTMASALWLMDALFAIAQKGVDGVNLHTFQNSANGLFDFERPNGQWRATVHPLYYGALMFAQAAPAGARLLYVAGDTAAARLRAWATLAPDHRLRVLLINDSLSGRAQVDFRVPRGFRGSAALERLTAPSAYATGGIALGGRSFPRGTSSGVLPAPVPQTLTPSGRGYAVSLPASSAVLVTLQP